MAFCATCGASVEGQFCAKCGSRAGAAPSAAAGPGFQQSEGLAENVAAALCYVLGLVTGIIFLILTPYNKNPLIRFHAFQSIFLNVACIVASVVLRIVLISMLHMWELSSLISLGIMGVFIYMVVMAYQGKTIVLPVIGPLAQQQSRN
ncbi:MAG: hypothetical protein ABI806_08240 [Candidatus Solibacter sp.]